MELSIDTASEMASVGLSEEGHSVGEATWRCQRQHSVELLPAIESLLTRLHQTRSNIASIFVNVGPGMYTGLRVGVATAKGLAMALDVQLIGVGRLELDAYPHASFPGPVLAVHRAGRGELAWAVYRGDPWREEVAPRLSQPEDMVKRIRRRTLIVGEVDDPLASRLGEVSGGKAIIASEAASIRHAAALAALGWERLTAGQAGDAALLKLLYLRPPVIGPRKSSR
jgi:tRNA threonylcarbamoyladenosine biosynthesis protein TsaB